MPSREGRRFEIGDCVKQIDNGESRKLHKSSKAARWRRRAAREGGLKLATAQNNFDIGESRTLHESDKAAEWRRRAAKGGDLKLAKAAMKI